jgi:hypothetical protein
MVPIEQKDWTEEDRASKLGQNHPLDLHEEAESSGEHRNLLTRVIVRRGEIHIPS